MGVRHLIKAIGNLNQGVQIAFYALFRQKSMGAIRPFSTLMGATPLIMKFPEK